MMGRSVRVGLLVAGLLVIAALVLQAGPSLLVEMIGRVGWRTLAVVAVYAAHQVMRTLALWRTILGCPVRFVDVLTIRLSSESAGTLTWTGSVLSEPVKGWLLTRRGLPAAEAYGAVAAEFLVYTTVSAGLTLSAFWLLLERGAVPPPLRSSVVVLTALTIAFLTGTAFAAVTGIGLIAPAVRAAGVVLGRSRTARAGEMVGHVERVLVSFLHAHPSRLAEVLAIEILAQSLLLVEVWVVLTALAGPIAPLDPLIIEGGTKLIGWAFFFIPSQVGASEAVYVALLGAMGFPAAAGLTLALIRRLRSLIIAATGVMLLARIGKAAPR